MWEGLHQIVETIDLPWLIIGDFNSSFSPANKQGGMDVISYATNDF